MRWIATRTIAAPSERVFRAVADPDESQRAIPEASPPEFLTERRSGVGTKFRATRTSRGKTQSFDMEVTELVPGDRVRIVNVTHGTLWDSVMSVRPDGGGQTVLTLTMDAVDERLFPRLMMRVIRGMVQKALEKDMSAIKEYCERGS